MLAYKKTFTMYPKIILQLIAYLKKFPGVGAKTAERFAFDLIKWDDENLVNISEILKNLKKNIVCCDECSCFLVNDKCIFCSSLTRNKNLLCIISSPKDVFAIENTNSYQGLYHIIENLLSPMYGKTEKDINIDKIIYRLEKHKINEIIMALDSTVEGDATSLFIKDKLSSYNVNISRLAFGLPIGSSLEYIDSSTLTQALIGRQNI